MRSSNNQQEDVDACLATTKEFDSDILRKQSVQQDNSPPLTSITCIRQETSDEIGVNNPKRMILRRTQSAVVASSRGTTTKIKISPRSASLNMTKSNKNNNTEESSQSQWTAEQAQMLQAFQDRINRQLFSDNTGDKKKLKIRIPKGSDPHLVAAMARAAAKAHQEQRQQLPPEQDEQSQPQQPQMILHRTPVRSRSRRIERSRTPLGGGHDSGRTMSTGRSASTTGTRRTQQTPMRSSSNARSRSRNRKKDTSMEQQSPQRDRSSNPQPPTASPSSSTKNLPRYCRPQPILPGKQGTSTTTGQHFEYENKTPISSHVCTNEKEPSNNERSKSQSPSRMKSRSSTPSQSDDQRTTKEEGRTVQQGSPTSPTRTRLEAAMNAPVARDRSRSKSRGRGDSQMKCLQKGLIQTPRDRSQSKSRGRSDSPRNSFDKEVSQTPRDCGRSKSRGRGDSPRKSFQMNTSAPRDCSRNKSRGRSNSPKKSPKKEFSQLDKNEKSGHFTILQPGQGQLFVPSPVDGQHSGDSNNMHQNEASSRIRRNPCQPRNGGNMMHQAGDDRPSCSRRQSRGRSQQCPATMEMGQSQSPQQVQPPQQYMERNLGQRKLSTDEHNVQRREKKARPVLLVMVRSDEAKAMSSNRSLQSNKEGTPQKVYKTPLRTRQGSNRKLDEPNDNGVVKVAQFSLRRNA